MYVTEKVSSDTEPRHSQTMDHELGGSHAAKAAFTARTTTSKQRKNTAENASRIWPEGDKTAVSVTKLLKG